MTKVACVGDSITRGTFVWRRRTRSYPSRLQALLGERFCVRNFGANGHAAQQGADLPYRASGAFTLSTDFRPDIVLLLLGTNDSRGANWKGAAAFERDYREIVAHYVGLPSRPRVLLLTPPTLFPMGRRQKVRYAMDPSAITEICAAVARIATETGCELIDINQITSSHPEFFRFDGVHPGGLGAALIAQAAYDALGTPPV